MTIRRILLECPLIGHRVLIEGTNMAVLNGSVGWANGYDPGTPEVGMRNPIGRYTVLLDSGDAFRIKSSNLRRASPLAVAEAAAAAAEAAEAAAAAAAAVEAAEAVVLIEQRAQPDGQPARATSGGGNGLHDVGDGGGRASESDAEAVQPLWSVGR